MMNIAVWSSICQFIGPAELSRDDWGRQLQKTNINVDDSLRGLILDMNGLRDYTSLSLVCRWLNHWMNNECQDFLFFRFIVILYRYDKLVPRADMLPHSDFKLKNKRRYRVRNTILSKVHFTWLSKCASEQYLDKFCTLLQYVPYHIELAASMDYKLKRMDNVISTMNLMRYLTHVMIGKADLIPTLRTTKLYFPRIHNYVWSSRSNQDVSVSLAYSLILKNCSLHEELADWIPMLLILLEDLGDSVLVDPHMAPEWLKDDHFISKAVQVNPLMLKYASNAVKNDRKLVLQAVKRDHLALEYVSPMLHDDELVVYSAARQEGRMLQFASERLRRDQQFILKLLRSSIKGGAYFYLSEELKRDRLVALASVKFKIHLTYIPNELWSDAAFAIEAVRINGWSLGLISDKIKEQMDMNLLIHAIESHDGLILKYIPFKLQTRELVSIAVQKNGEALKFASEELRNDQSIISIALKNSTLAVQHVPNWALKDRQLILNVLVKNGQILKCLTNELGNDREVVLAAVTNCGAMLQYLSNEFKGDRDLVLAAVRNNGLALKYASDELKNDEKVVLAAVSNNGLALDDASDMLKYNANIVLAAVKKRGFSLAYRNDKNMMLLACKYDSSAYESVSPSLQMDQDVITAAATMT